ncbi:MAG: motility protein A [Rickettsiales bacterium]
MSLSSILGAIAGFALLLGAIALNTNNWMSFLSFSSFLMVFGGTVAAAYLSYQARYVNLAFIAIWHTFKKAKSTREGLNTEIMRLIKWAYVVQANGLVGLENELKNTKLGDPLLQYMLLVVASGHKAEDLRPMLETAAEAEFERNTVPVTVLKMMAGSAPAFGMIGTLVGLVIMLQGLGDDLSALGKGMAVALLTTLYGVAFARLIFSPAALKLQQKEEIHRFRNYLMVEGLIMLAEKRGPRYMQDRLNGFLDPAIHFDIDKQIRR